jgi:hypothetical protein
MPIHPKATSTPAKQTQATLVRVRRQARALLRAARGESLVTSMPALRRLHTAGLFAEVKLSALLAQRQQVRLKHCLRTLAIEFGYSSWEALRPCIGDLPAHLLDSDRLYAAGSASLHQWFANAAQAHAYAAIHGGRVVLVGRHAVLVDASTAA